MESKTFRRAARMRTMSDALFDEINRRCQQIRREGRDLIDLGQAVPDFSPPAVLADAVNASLSDSRTHCYAPDLGLPELRRAVAEHLQREYGVNDVSAENTVITAGANQGFHAACICLIDEGDRVGLLSPFFVNHQMAIQGCGGVPIEIIPDEEFCYSEDVIRDAVRQHNLRAIVVVNPSNPTGKVFSREELTTVLAICREYDLPLLCDEVYRAFVYGDAEMTSIGSLPDASDCSMTFGSFSKEYGMTGWRVGWMCVPESLTPQLLKIQDYSVICAPHISQIAATAVLRNEPEYANQFCSIFDNRRKTLTESLRRGDQIDVYEGQGACFVWCRLPGGLDSDQAALELLDEEAVSVMPGTMFGAQWFDWIRLSYGRQSEDRLVTAAERITRFFT